MDEKIFKVIMTLIPVLGAIVTYFIVPFIKSNMDLTKLNQYKEWVSLAVKTAEMLWTETGHGEDKKAYVVKTLNNMLNAKKTVVTQEQLNLLIEAAVLELNKNK